MEKHLSYHAKNIMKIATAKRAVSTEPLVLTTSVTRNRNRISAAKPTGRLSRRQKAKDEWLKVRQEWINDLLQLIYGRPRLLSDILKEGGISEAAILNIRENRKEAYIKRLLVNWFDCWRRSLGEQALKSLRTGSARWRDAKLGAGKEKEDQEELDLLIGNDVINKLSSPESRQALEELAIKAAKQVLNKEKGQQR